MPVVSPLESAIVALVTAVVGLAVGLGAFTDPTGQAIVAAAVSLVGVGFMVANSLHHQAAAKLGKTVAAIGQLQASIIAAVLAVIGLAVALGAFNSTVAQALVGGIPAVIAAVFAIVNAVQHSANATATLYKRAQRHQPPAPA